MKLTANDRLNLISTLSQTQFYDSLPVKLEDDAVGLDRERHMDLIQRLIDNQKVWECAHVARR